LGAASDALPPCPIRAALLTGIDHLSFLATMAAKSSPFSRSGTPKWRRGRVPGGLSGYQLQVAASAGSRPATPAPTTRTSSAATRRAGRLMPPQPEQAPSTSAQPPPGRGRCHHPGNYPPRPAIPRPLVQQWHSVRQPCGERTTSAGRVPAVAGGGGRRPGRGSRAGHGTPTITNQTSPHLPRPWAGRYSTLALLPVLESLLLRPRGKFRKALPSPMAPQFHKPLASSNTR
jgi:hypothetical protein